jgi:quinol monooxygenase YgiN
MATQKGGGVWNDWCYRMAWMVRLTLVLRPSVREGPALMDALRFMMVSTRLESGCVNCAVRVDSDASVHYEEEWATEIDMRRRVRSDRFISLLSLMESVHEPPRVQFDFLTASRGLDYIAEVRGVESQ